MKLSIRKIFFNLKLALIVLSIGISALSIQLFTISHDSDHVSALKNQHILIKKIMNTNLTDISMASIILNGEISELALYTQLSTRGAIVDFSSKEEQSYLETPLITASTAFQEAALFWLESMPVSRKAMYQRMVTARNVYLIEIDKRIDYKIQSINEAVKIAKVIVVILFLLTIATFFLYRLRLNQIYRDINQACSSDTDTAKVIMATNEINTILKRLSSRNSTTTTNPALSHHQSGVHTEKGLHSAYATKRSQKKSALLFLVVFEIDQYPNLITTLPKEDIGTIFKKLSTIIAMYEQPMDVIAHLDDDRFAFLMSRNDKKIALSDAEKIVSSVKDSVFTSSKGALKITLSAGFILKLPAKTLEDSLTDAKKVVQRAKELGGNRVTQFHELAEAFR